MAGWTRIERCEGPECPRCGCADAEILAEPDLSVDLRDGWFAAQRPRGRRKASRQPDPQPQPDQPAGALGGKPQNWGTPGRARCGHCGAVFSYRRGKGSTTEDTEEHGERPAQQQTPPPSPQNAVEDPPLGLPDEPPQPAERAEPEGAVVYRPVTCPRCKSTQTRVTSTRRPVRRHKCRECEFCFKSVEKGIDD